MMAAATGAGAAIAGSADARARSAISDEEVSALLEAGGADATRPFDLSSRRISRTELPVLDLVCRSFAERATASLSTMLNRPVSLKFEGVQRCKVADALAALPAPSCSAVVRLKPLEGEAFASVEPGLLLALLDGFFGGSGRVVADPQAAVAPAAQRFLGLVARTLGGDFQAAWAQAARIEFELLRIEPNPRLLHLGEAMARVLIARFGVEFAARSGFVHWLIPESILAPVRESLAAEGGRPAARPAEAWAPVIGAALQSADLETRAILAEAQISLGDLVRLTPGDVIPIDAPQQVVLFAGDVPLYRGRFGLSGGRNAVKILSRGPA